MERLKGFDAEVEGAFPQIVLEVVSPETTACDQEDKFEAGQLLRVRE